MTDTASGSTTDPTLFERRRHLILAAGLPAVLEKQALSMCLFDEATDPDALRTRGLGELAAAIESCTRFLVFRFLQRASWALRGREFEPPAAEDERHRAVAVQVEARFRSAIVAAFPPPVAGPAFGVRDFEQAFAAFVTGEIGMGALAGVPPADPFFCHGVPDSANHFCCAEAALLFVRLGLNADFWRTTLPTFVGTAHVFAANFWSRRERTLSAYDCRNLRGAVPASATVLATIDHYWRALTLPELAGQFGRLLAVSLRDDRSIGRPVPAAKEFP
jgi:hypothetical protein